MKSSMTAETAHSHPGPVLVLWFFRAVSPDESQLEYLYAQREVGFCSVNTQKTTQIPNVPDLTDLERSCKDRRRNLSEQERTRTSSLQHDLKLSNRVTLCFNVKPW